MSIRAPVLSANVCRIVRETGAAPRLQRVELRHCKTLTSWIYGVITWVPPEGGGGPKYTGM
jgi:hypothetical protein